MQNWTQVVPELGSFCVPYSVYNQTLTWHWATGPPTFSLWPYATDDTVYASGLLAQAFLTLDHEVLLMNNHKWICTEHDEPMICVPVHRPWQHHIRGNEWNAALSTHSACLKFNIKNIL
jgi:hypothetical protein